MQTVKDTHSVKFLIFCVIAAIYHEEFTTKLNPLPLTQEGMSSNDASISCSANPAEYREKRTPPPSSLRRGSAGIPKNGEVVEAFPIAASAPSLSSQTMTKEEGTWTAGC